MGDIERPVPERLGDQDEQAQHLTRTGNGPTVEDESALLAEVHGPADMAGFYSRPGPVDQDGAEPAVDGEGEAADQDNDASAADTAKGGDSA